jgi:hypothetical protein
MFPVWWQSPDPEPHWGNLQDPDSHWEQCRSETLLSSPSVADPECFFIKPSKKWVRDPRSGKTYSGSRIQGLKGSGSRIRNTAFDYVYLPACAWGTSSKATCNPILVLYGIRPSVGHVASGLGFGHQQQEPEFCSVRFPHRNSSVSGRAWYGGWGSVAKFIVPYWGIKTTMA